MKTHINANNENQKEPTEKKNNSDRGSKFHIRKADLILAAVLVTITLIAVLVIELGVKKKGSVVVVKIDGQIKYELQLDKDQELKVNGYNGGTNDIVIRNKTVVMTDADCPDKICVHTGAISKTGETIVCLPHRVVVEIKGSDAEIDSIVN